MSRSPWVQLRPWRRHSLVLLVAGVVYILVGLSYILIPLTRDRAALLKLPLALSFHSIHFWGFVWILFGLAAILSGRWPPASEKWGYAAMGAFASLWGSFYLLGIVFLHAPVAGISSTIVWALVAFLWWAIAGLDNPDDLHEPPVSP